MSLQSIMRGVERPASVCVALITEQIDAHAQVRDRRFI